MSDTQSVPEVNPSSINANLLEIESSDKSEYVLSLLVSKFCGDFATPSGVGILKSGSYTKLGGIISMILLQ